MLFRETKTRGFKKGNYTWFKKSVFFTFAQLDEKAQEDGLDDLGADQRRHFAQELKTVKDKDIY